MIFFGGLSRKAPSNARGDDPFLGGFFFIFFLPRHGGRSPQAAPGLGFSLDFSGGKPTFLLCGNLLSLDRGNGFAQAFIFPGWFVPSGSRSDRAGPGLGRGCWGWLIHSYVIGRGNTATAYLQAGVIRPAPGPTADAVVDVQVQRTGGESRLKDEEVVLFSWRKNARSVPAGKRRWPLQAGRRRNAPAPQCGGAVFRRKFIGRELI